MDAAEENRRLRQHLRYLIRNQAHLERRLGRIENSVVFRFLRSAGRAFGMGRDDGPSEEAAYTAWVRETPAPSGVQVHSRIGLIVPDGDDAARKRTLASIEAQDHPGWELVTVDQPALHPFIGIVGAGSILEPDAIRAWLSKLENNSSEIVYSDWDLIDAAGRRQSPRFTPEFSPELLSATPYWGCCFAAKTELVRQIDWTDPYQLSRRLSSADKSVARIPKILWHLPAAQAPARFEDRPAVGNAETASIVICSRNAGRLERCVASLKASIDARHQVIVVAHRIDGDSADLERVAQRHGAQSIAYDGAFHFGRMNERGASLATGSVLVLLNDDVRPISPDWLEHMLRQAARPEIGVTGAMLLYPSGAIQHAGIVVGDTLLPAHLGRSQRDTAFWPWLRMTREVTAVTGACLAIRRSVWDQLGGFDPRFPVNYNDVDLCLRAWKQGLRVLVETRATLTHDEAATRVPTVRPQESELFWELWGDVLGAPDAFFNPQLELRDEMIRLPRPWPRQR